MPKKRTTNRDHAKRRQRPMMEDEVIAAQLEQLVTPAVVAQEKYYRQLGMRDRILNLPLMVAAVLTLIWRDVAGVRELGRMLAREGFLWCEPKQVSQQALSQSFMTFPAEISRSCDIFSKTRLFEASLMTGAMAFPMVVPLPVVKTTTVAPAATRPGVDS